VIVGLKVGVGFKEEPAGLVCVGITGSTIFVSRVAVLSSTAKAVGTSVSSETTGVFVEKDGIIIPQEEGITCANIEG